MTNPTAYAATVDEASADRRGEDEGAAADSGRARVAAGDPARGRARAVHEVRPGLLSRPPIPAS